MISRSNNTDKLINEDAWRSLTPLGSLKQAAVVRVNSQMTEAEAMDYFNANWPMIGDIAALTPPKNGVVELVFVG